MVAQDSIHFLALYFVCIILLLSCLQFYYIYLLCSNNLETNSKGEVKKKLRRKEGKKA